VRLQPQPGRPLARPPTGRRGRKLAVAVTADKCRSPYCGPPAPRSAGARGEPRLAPRGERGSRRRRRMRLNPSEKSPCLVPANRGWGREETEVRGGRAEFV